MALRTPEDVAGDFLMSWEEVDDELLYEDDELRGLLRENPTEADRILNGTNRAGRLLDGASEDHFSLDDALGKEVARYVKEDLTGGWCSVRERIADPSLFDRAIAGRTKASESDRLTSALGGLSGGFAGGIVNAVLLFLVTVPVAELAGVDVVGTRMGGGVLLGCLAAALAGSEAWHRFISYERPYVATANDDAFETNVFFVKAYVVCVVGTGLLALFVSQRAPSAAAWAVFSGGLPVVLARIGLALLGLGAAVATGFVLLFGAGFGALSAAYPRSGRPVSRVASPVQFLLLAPLLLVAWGALGGAFYPVIGLGPLALGAVGVAAYPVTGLVAAGLLRVLP